MKKRSQHRIMINMLIAAAISIIVNFSYLLWTSSMFRSREMRVPDQMPHLYIWLLVVYWFVLALVLLSVVTGEVNEKDSSKQYVRRIFYCVFITAVFYLLSPISNRGGEMMTMIASNRLINPMVIMKSSFTLIVSVLYGKIYELVFQKQNMVIENEQLKNENLLTRYNMLVSQINPHFFFNSLNSLSMLVREGDREKALTYIDRLSDTFRHIIQKGQNEMSTLGEEMEFLSGYKYVHEVRYAGKLFFDIDIREEYTEWLLPALSLQPLIENAVKHNSITLARPFHISIRTEAGNLVVSNPLIPKISQEDGTGTGLKNLASRYALLTGKQIVIQQTDDEFIVHLPLSQPQA